MGNRVVTLLELEKLVGAGVQGKKLPMPGTSPVVDADNLRVSRDELRVEGTNDGLLHDLGPLRATQLGHLLVHRFEVGLADLKH